LDEPFEDATGPAHARERLLVDSDSGITPSYGYDLVTC
jgi:hypothetical protein